MTCARSSLSTHRTQRPTQGNCVGATRPTSIGATTTPRGELVESIGETALPGEGGAFSKRADCNLHMTTSRRHELSQGAIGLSIARAVPTFAAPAPSSSPALRERGASVALPASKSLALRIAGEGWGEGAGTRKRGRCSRAESIVPAVEGRPRCWRVVPISCAPLR
jgi:hypothetical protein